MVEDRPRDGLMDMALEWLHHHGLGGGACPRALRPIVKVAFLTGQVWSSPLAWGHRRGAVVRWLRWQVWRRVVCHPVEVQLSGGLWLQCPPESGIGGLLVATGSHEPAELEFTRRVVRPGSLAVDVGANIGLYTVALGGRGIRVAAIEPSARSRDSLQWAISRNRLWSSVRVFPLALSDAPGCRRFTTGLDVRNHLLEKGSEECPSEWVQVETLDRLLISDPGFFDRPVSFVKVDVEGADENVLRGAINVLRRDRPVVLVETWAGGRDIRAFLNELDVGYRPWLYRWGASVVEELPTAWSGQANLIFIADVQLGDIERRLATASVRGTTCLPAVHWRRSGELSGTAFRERSVLRVAIWSMIERGITLLCGHRRGGPQ